MLQWDNLGEFEEALMRWEVRDDWTLDNFPDVPEIPWEGFFLILSTSAPFPSYGRQV